MMLGLPYPIFAAGLLGALATQIWLYIAKGKRLPAATNTAGWKSWGAKHGHGAPELDRAVTVNTFPPSRRHVLAQLLPQCERSGRFVSVQEMVKNQLPTTRVQDLDRDGQYTPTGFSTEEIKALGRFPDYALLSGVAHPSADPAFDVSKTHFRPFRPFRAPYHQTMALQKLDTDHWLELEHNYERRMAQRRAILAEHADRVLFSTPGSELACRELMEMALQFLCIRYPHCFQLLDDNRRLHNRLLRTTTDLDKTEPLRVLFENVPEDFVIMCRNEHDGMYYLRAAIVCSSVGWSIAQHKGKILRRIHDNVPQWDKMAYSVDRWFTKLPTDKPAQRGSWRIEDWEAFFTPPPPPAATTAASRDPAPAPAPAQAHAQARARTAADVQVDDLQLRCDWQTLRRMPLSGAIVFNVKTAFAPLSRLAAEPGVPALLHRVLTESARDLIEYKVEPHVEPVAVAALAKWAETQRADGLVPDGWEPVTLAENPFFPGWEEKARACPF